jgi:hypothetical protein
MASEGIAATLLVLAVHALPAVAEPKPDVYGPRPAAGGLCDPAAWPLPVDGALCDAARALAETLGDATGESGGLEDPDLARWVAHHLWRAGVIDAHVQPRLLRASSYAGLYGRIGEIVADAMADPASATPHLGVGLAPRKIAGGALTGEPLAVVLLARRLVHVEPFPMTLTEGEAVTITGRFSSGVVGHSAWVGTDGGPVRVARLDLADRRFLVKTDPLPPGRHVLEILVDAGEGPEVALLGPVHVGRPLPEVPAPAWRDGDGDPVAAVHQRLVDHRRALGLAVPRRDPDLDALAAARAEAMATRGRPVHKPAPNEDAVARLSAAGYPFAWAAEDLSVGPGALPAFQGLFDSPAHRRLLEHPRARHAGVGVVRDGDRTWLAVLLADPIEARPAVASASAARVVEGRLLHRAEDALRAARRRNGLPDTVRDPALDQLAADLARHLSARDVATDEASVAQVRRRALDVDPSAAAVSVEVVVGGRPEDLVRAPSGVEDDCDRIGLGVIASRSARFGGERLWIVAICAHHGDRR